MALNFRITKAKHGKLTDEQKELYVADGDDHFKLDVTGLADDGALKRSLERSQEEVADLKLEAKEANAKIKTLTDAAGDGGQDVARLTRSHERKIATLNEEHATAITGLQSFIRTQLVDGRATALATEISTVPTLMTPHIRSRLDVDFTGTEPKLVIKGADGKPDPALTIDKLKAEVVANKEFASILVGSKATGSAAQRGALPATGATPAIDTTATRGDDSKVNVNELGTTDFLARITAKRAAREAASGKTAQE